MAFQTRTYPLDDAQAQARWQALWEVSPQRSSFSSLAYLRAAAQAFELQAEMHLVAGEAHDEAGALVLWRQRGPYREVIIPPFTQYSALLLRTEPAASRVHARTSAFEALLASLEDHFAVLSFFIPLSDARPALWRNWQVTPYYTYCLSLQEGDLLRRWSSATRRTFRKHEATYRFEDQEEDAALIIEQCAESYRRHDRPLPADPEQLRRLAASLKTAGMVHLFTVTQGGPDPHGGLAVLHDGQTAHYWIAGSTPGPAMTVLLGHTLPRLKERGILQFDFVGANTPSIAEFKRHFGPTLVPYFYLHKTTRAELRVLRSLKGR